MFVDRFGIFTRKHSSVSQQTPPKIPFLGRIRTALFFLFGNKPSSIFRIIRSSYFPLFTFKQKTHKNLTREVILVYSCSVTDFQLLFIPFNWSYFFPPTINKPHTLQKAQFLWLEPWAFTDTSFTSSTRWKLQFHWMSFHDSYHKLRKQPKRLSVERIWLLRHVFWANSELSLLFVLIFRIMKNRIIPF